jgi:hypothetical protein
VITQITLALALAIVTGPVLGQSLTCEAHGDLTRCFSHQGYETTEERSGDYVHGHDNRGRAWSEWAHDGRTYTYTWPTR